MEVLTTAEMERADRLAIAAGTPGFALMLSAGQAVAEAATDLVEEGPIVVVAGPGNNGGDGFVAAAELVAQGREVSVILMCERDALKGDAASAARGWKYPVLPFTPQAIGKPALIIDALFGAGLSRPVEGEPREMIEAINANGAPVLAVDLPSGINGTIERGHGHGGARHRDRDLLPQEAGASAVARSHALRTRARRRHRHPAGRAGRNPSARLREHAAILAQIVSGPAHRRPQICPRPCAGRLRRHGGDRCGAARRARRLARGRGPRDAGLAARRAGRSTPPR